MRQVSRYFMAARSWLKGCWGAGHLVAGRSWSPSKMASSSSTHLACTSGWLASSHRVKDMLVAVVSWPSNMNVSTSSLISLSERTVPPWLLSSSRSRKANRRFWPESCKRSGNRLIQPTWLLLPSRASSLSTCHSSFFSAITFSVKPWSTLRTPRILEVEVEVEVGVKVEVDVEVEVEQVAVVEEEVEVEVPTWRPGD